MASSVETTLQSLMGAIQSGEFGEWIPPQDQLAARYGVSRTVLREAISKLEYSNVLNVRPKTGTCVMPREQWFIVHPEIARWVFESSDRHHHMTDALDLVRTMGYRAAGLATIPDDHDHVPKANTLEAVADFHGWIFEQSSNRFHVQLSPIVSEFFIACREGLTENEKKSLILQTHFIRELVLSDVPDIYDRLQSVYENLHTVLVPYLIRQYLPVMEDAL